MWGQEKKVGTSSSEQEGKEVVMVASNSTNTAVGNRALELDPFSYKGTNIPGPIGIC